MLLIALKTLLLQLDQLEIVFDINEAIPEMYILWDQNCLGCLLQPPRPCLWPDLPGAHVSFMKQLPHASQIDIPHPQISFMHLE